MIVFKKIFDYLGLLFLYLIFIFLTGRHNWALPLTLSTVLIYNFRKPFKKIALFILPLFVLVLIGGFIEGFSKAATYLISLIFAGLLAYFSNKIKLVVYVVLGAVLLFLTTYYLLPNVIFYHSNKNAVVDIEYPFPELYDRNLSKVSFDKDKMYVLDFWHTRCAPCYRKFPEFERVFKLYQGQNDIQFYSINVENGYDSFDRAKEIVDTLNYSYETLFAKEEIEEILGISYYPMLIIIKKGRIKYRGSFASDKNILFSSLEEEIQNIKNNTSE